MSPNGPPRRWLSWCVAGPALLLAAGATVDHFDTRGERLALLARLNADTLRWLPEEVARDLRRERDPVWQGLRLARSLVAAEMDPTFLEEVETAKGPEASLERLELARELAAAALAERPSAWQAPMLLGAATYLIRSRARDPRLFTDYRDWEAPLELAVALSPGRTEAGRFLTVAYLELWPVVSEDKRQTARELIADAFRDPGIFHRLAPIWLSVVTRREEAFAPIPPDPAAWLDVQTLLAHEEDWEGFRAARGRYREALAIRRRTDLEEADRLLAGGETAAARDLLLGTMALGDPETGAVPTLVQTLVRLPPGPAGRHAGALRLWLGWALDLCLLDRCPLPAASLARIAGLAGELEPEEAALAFLFAGRLPEAERLERRTARIWHPRWSPYLLAKARLLARRGEPGPAAAALDGVHPSWKEHPVYRQIRNEVVQAGGVVEDPAREPPAGPREPLGRREAWRPAGADPFDGGGRSGSGVTDRLELALAADADGLRIAIPAAPAQGAVVEIRLDGEPVATPVVGPGDELEVRVPVSQGLHRLEVETLAGGRVYPGEVRRLGHAPPTPRDPAPSAAAGRSLRPPAAPRR